MSAGLDTSLDPTDLEFVRSFVYARSAIVVGADKTYLVQDRLSGVARDVGIESLRALVARLRCTPDGLLHTRVVEAMTTNETSFFRDVHPFEVLRDRLLPELVQRRAGVRRLAIWSAACSTGQEPYSIAMLLREHFPQLDDWQVRICASDLSGEVLLRAEDGIYTLFEANRGLPAHMLTRWFRTCPGGVQLDETIRRQVEFYRMNLTATWPTLPMMDVVFLRNVMVYFDVETKRAILAKVRQILRPDGYLFLGGAETTLYLDDAFERVPGIDRAICYRLRGAGADRP